MTHVISIINLKGGVGKTTTSIALAEVFSAEMRKKVLVIDLDPQTNATLMLIGETKWRKLNEQGHTLAQLFKDTMKDAMKNLGIDEDTGTGKKFTLETSLQKKVGDVTWADSIDLLPSSLDLIEVQDTIALSALGNSRIHPSDILQQAIESKLNDYDIVIVDCPPNLGTITQNGLRISEAYIIPTIPDYLSTYGIPQIVNRILASKNKNKEITPLGIVITKRQSTTLQGNVIKYLKGNNKLPKVYETEIKQATKTAEAAERTSTKRTLSQKYGSKSVASFKALAQEIWKDLESQP